MSRIGKRPIDIPSGVTIAADNSKLTVKGPKGESSLNIPSVVKVETDGKQARVSRTDDSPLARSCHGTIHRLVCNMIEGVTKGYVKELEIQGVGFKAAVQGRKLVMTLGFSSPLEFEAPEGIQLKVDGGNIVVVSGIDKQKVGDTAARIRGFCPAEPYKGKGIRYKGEHVRRKVGKSVA